MTVTTAREMPAERVGTDEAPPAGLRLRLQQDRSGGGPQAATAGNRERSSALLAGAGPGSS